MHVLEHLEKILFVCNRAVINGHIQFEGYEYFTCGGAFRIFKMEDDGFTLIMSCRRLKKKKIYSKKTQPS